MGGGGDAVEQVAVTAAVVVTVTLVLAAVAEVAIYQYDYLIDKRWQWKHISTKPGAFFPSKPGSFNQEEHVPGKHDLFQDKPHGSAFCLTADIFCSRSGLNEASRRR